jgi:hypothetical protein
MADDGIVDIDKLVKAASGGPDTSYVAPTIKSLRETEKEKEAVVDKATGEFQETLKRDKANVDKKTPESVDLQPWKEQPTDTDPVKAFGSLGSVFGILASAFTHQPWQNAMNASASAINAVKAGDRQKYEDAYDAWKTNTKLMLDRHNMQYQDYQMAMEKMKTDVAEGSAMLTALSAKYGDRITETMTEAGLHEKLGEAWASRQRSAVQLAGILPELEDHNLKIRALFDYQEALKSGDSAKIATAKQSLLAVLGKLSETSGRVTPEREALNRYLEEHPDATGEDIQKFVKAGKGATSFIDTQLSKAQADAEVAGKPMTPDEIGHMKRRLEGKDVLSPVQLDTLQGKAQVYTEALDQVAKAREILERATFEAGKTGKVLGATESVGNLLKLTDDTDRRDFESAISYLRLNAPVLLKHANTTSRAIGGDQALVDNIIRGGGWGDTYANVKSSLDNMNQIMMQDLRLTQQEYKQSQGQDMKIPGLTPGQGQPSSEPWAPPSHDKPIGGP